jgi:TolB protein
VGGHVPVVEGVCRASASGASGSTHAGIAGNGTLVYVPGPVASESGLNDLALFDRKGGNEPLKLPPAAYRGPRVSRDGRFVTYEIEDNQGAAIWVYDLSGASAPRRLTFSGTNRAPIWSPDGQWIAFQSDHEGDLAIFRQRADGSGTAERITTPDKGTQHIPQDWTRDGAHVLVTIRSDQGSALATLNVSDRRLTPFGDARSPALINAVFSPDGCWVAYQTRDGNTNQVFVAPFPSTGAKYLLPSAAGHPQWSSKNEIVVNSGPQRSMIVQVTTGPTFSFGKPMDFPRAGRSEPNPALANRAADFMPDGERLIGLLNPTQVAATVDELVVVLNWFEELRQRVPMP